jgi:hypothetical protein
MNVSLVQQNARTAVCILNARKSARNHVRHVESRVPINANISSVRKSAANYAIGYLVMSHVKMSLKIVNIGVSVSAESLVLLYVVYAMKTRFVSCCLETRTIQKLDLYGLKIADIALKHLAWIIGWSRDMDQMQRPIPKTTLFNYQNVLDARHRLDVISDTLITLKPNWS